MVYLKPGHTGNAAIQTALIRHSCSGAITCSSMNTGVKPAADECTSGATRDHRRYCKIMMRLRHIGQPVLFPYRNNAKVLIRFILNIPYTALRSVRRDPAPAFLSRVYLFVAGSTVLTEQVQKDHFYRYTSLPAAIQIYLYHCKTMPVILTCLNNIFRLI